MSKKSEKKKKRREKRRKARLREKKRIQSEKMKSAREAMRQENDFSLTDSQLLALASVLLKKRGE